MSRSRVVHLNITDSGDIFTHPTKTLCGQKLQRTLASARRPENVTCLRCLRWICPRCGGTLAGNGLPVHSLDYRLECSKCKQKFLREV